MRSTTTFCLILSILNLVRGTVIFKEDFNDDGWTKRWVIPTKWKAKEDMGTLINTAGEKYFADEKDKGILSTEDARFYAATAKFPKTFNNKGKDFVLQYSVKMENKIDCGGAYIKVMGKDIDQDSFGGETPYQVMFGPDICGSTRRTHLIFTYKDTNYLINNDIRTETDSLSHLYTLHLKSDGTYSVMIDLNEVRSGTLEDDWDFLGPKEIPDPDSSKPEDWVDFPMMVDPSDVKPEGYDDIPEKIPDPEATMPDDWDEEDDGEWEAPLIDNPEWNGPWKPKEIENPDYKGPWVHPKIPNPDYSPDPELYNFIKDAQYVGFELWQFKSGILFDDILVTDSIEDAFDYAEKTYKVKKGPEEEMYKKMKEEEAAKMAAEVDDMGIEEEEDELEDDFNDEL